MLKALYVVWKAFIFLEKNILQSLPEHYRDSVVPSLPPAPITELCVGSLHVVISAKTQVQLQINITKGERVSLRLGLNTVIDSSARIAEQAEKSFNTKFRHSLAFPKSRHQEMLLLAFFTTRWLLF